MNPRGEDLAAAAAALIGTPFRLQGRNPQLGLDCVGLVACSLEAIGMKPVSPTGYSLRNVSVINHLEYAEASGLKVVKPPFEPGDIVLVKPGPGQHHLLIADGSCGFIHAHAGLRRIVRLSSPLPWPAIALWRPKSQD